MNSVDQEKIKFLQLLDEERRKNELERKELEERVQQVIEIKSL